MTPKGEEFNDSWIVYPENGTDTSSFYKQPIKIAFNQASLPKIYKSEVVLLPISLQEFLQPPLRCKGCFVLWFQSQSMPEICKCNRLSKEQMRQALLIRLCA